MRSHFRIALYALFIVVVTKGQLHADIEAILNDEKACDLALRDAANLSELKVAELELDLAASRNVVDARLRLLGYYGYGTRGLLYEKAAHAYVEHYLWFIENRPRSAVFQWVRSIGMVAQPSAKVKWEEWLAAHTQVEDLSEEEQAKANAFKAMLILANAHNNCDALWQRNLELHPVDLAILKNAAWYYEYANSSYAEQLLIRGINLDTANPYWPREIGQMYHRQLSRRTSNADEKAELCRIALEWYDKANALDERTSSFDLYHAAHAALTSGQLQRAKSLAERILREYPDDDAKHESHTILGLVAIRKGNMALAKNHLRSSGEVQSTPVLGSFGPKFQLAEELLDTGANEAVLAYLRQCTTFWKLSDGVLEKWMQDIRTGRESEINWFRDKFLVPRGIRATP